MNSGHRAWLEALRDGVKPGHPNMPASEWRGLVTCRQTLLGWGAIEGDRLTDVGRQLLGDAQ
jgi:hypothetical protein